MPRLAEGQLKLYCSSMRCRQAGTNTWRATRRGLTPIWSARPGERQRHMRGSRRGAANCPSLSRWMRLRLTELAP